MKTGIKKRKQGNPVDRNLTQKSPSKLRLTKNQVITLLASIIALLGTIINTVFLYYATIDTSKEIQKIEKSTYNNEKIKTLLPYISRLNHIWEGFVSTWNGNGKIKEKPIEFIIDILNRVEKTNTVYMEVKYFLNSEEQAYFDKISLEIGELSSKATLSLTKKKATIQDVVDDDNLLELLKMGTKFKLELSDKIEEELIKP